MPSQARKTLLQANWDSRQVLLSIKMKHRKGISMFLHYKQTLKWKKFKIQQQRYWAMLPNKTSVRILTVIIFIFNFYFRQSTLDERKIKSKDLKTNRWNVERIGNISAQTKEIGHFWDCVRAAGKTQKVAWIRGSTRDCYNKSTYWYCFKYTEQCF